MKKQKIKCTECDKEFESYSHMGGHGHGGVGGAGGDGSTPKQTTIEEKAYNSPSYDKSISIEDRLRDFLGAYHVVLNGVVAHDPYVLHMDDGGGMCCSDSKDRLVEYVLQIIRERGNHENKKD